MIDSGLPITLASDYNPGSSPSGNIEFILSLACIKLKMTPEEAINALTINGAHAMEVQNELGSIEKDKIANLIITEKLPSNAFIPYSFGKSLIKKCKSFEMKINIFDPLKRKSTSKIPICLIALLIFFAISKNLILKTI